MPTLNSSHRWLKPNSYMLASTVDFNMYECFSQYNLSIDQNYFLVHINYQHDQNPSDVDLFSYIDTYCTELLQKSQAKFIFDSISEGSNGMKPNFIQLLERSAVKHNIPLKNIFYLTIDTAESKIQSEINIFYFNAVLHMVLSNFDANSVNALRPTHLFSCLNRKPRYWRSRLQYELLNTEFKDDILYSHPKVTNIKDFISRPYNNKEVEHNANMVKFYSNLEEKFYDDVNQPCTMLSDIFSKVAFDLTMLSVQDRQEEVIDEKVFKPMLAKRPIAIWGIPNINLQGLASLGFKTYEDWFDLSFDSEADTETRMHLLVKEILRLCNHLKSLSPEQLLAWSHKNQSVLDHNYNLVKDFKINHDSYKQFIRTINAT